MANGNNGKKNGRRRRRWIWLVSILVVLARGILRR